MKESGVPIYPTYTSNIPHASSSRSLSSATERGLRATCAEYDWRYHLTAFDGQTPSDFPSIERLERANRKARNPFGSEFEIGTYSTGFKLPGLTAVLAKQHICSFCGLVARSLRDRATLEDIKHISNHDALMDLTFYSPFQNDLDDKWVLLVRLCSDEREAIGKWSVVELRFSLYSESDTASLDNSTKLVLAHAGRKSMMVSQIDMNIAQTWWKTCKDHHQSCRSSMHSAVPNLNPNRAYFRVVERVTSQVVIAPAGCRYVALSYVWGNIKAHQSKKDDIIVPEDGDSTEVIPFRLEDLPKTVRDALYVVELIGERYLWVDTMCIVQDDEMGKMESISNMHQIYEGAQLTIIAADGADADSGLLGLDPESRAIECHPEYIDGIGLLLHEARPNLKQTPLASRGWTYQEEQLSSRMLIFAHKRVWYECKQSSFGEARPQTPLREENFPRNLSSELANIWNDDDQVFYQYTEHVKYYTSRNLTYPGDVLRALEGITRRHFRSHQCYYIWGLPLTYLIHALAWEPVSIDLSRRGYSGTRLPTPPYDYFTAVEKAAFPSWTWAGWVGPVQYETFEYPWLSYWDDPDSDRRCQMLSDISWSGVTASSKRITSPSPGDHFCVQGILHFSTTCATLEFDKIKQYHEEIDDTTRFRTPIMDDGSKWISGTKEAILLSYISTPDMNDDFRSCTVLLIRRSEDRRICYREALLRLQMREWVGASPKMENIRLG